MTTSTLHILNDLDNVAVALRDLSRGEQLTLSDEYSLLIEDDVERGHKVALRALARGDLVFKFGHVIGRASTLVRTYTRTICSSSPRRPAMQPIAALGAHSNHPVRIAERSMASDDPMEPSPPGTSSPSSAP